jgi:hypothetical protein
MPNRNCLLLAICGVLLLGVSTVQVAKAQTQSTFVIDVRNLADDMALTGVPSRAGVRVYVWNITRSPNTLLAQADVGTEGKAVFVDLPPSVWSTSSYAVSANMTWDGDDNGVLLFPRTEIYGGTGIHGETRSLASLLSGLTGSIYDSRWSKFDADKRILYVYLTPLALQPLDRAGFPFSNGASVQVVLSLDSNSVCDFGMFLSNGTFGQEFTGNLPDATPNLRVGWVAYPSSLPALPALFDAGTKLRNITVLIRYKVLPDNPIGGPVVGRFQITGFANMSLTTGIGKYSSADPFMIDAASGTASVDNLPLNSKSTVAVNVKWVYLNLTDSHGDDWLSTEAWAFVKWCEGPIGVPMYVGNTLLPGRILMRLPSTLMDPAMERAFNFSLFLAIEYRFEVTDIVYFKPKDLPLGIAYGQSFRVISDNSFKLRSRLSLSLPYSNVIVRIDGVTYITDERGTILIPLAFGEHVIEVPALLPISNGTRVVFENWSNGEDQSRIAIVVIRDTNLTASYKTQHYLRIVSYGDPKGEGWYIAGSTATVAVTTVSIWKDFFTNYVFEGWRINGTVVSTSPSYSFTVTEPVSFATSWKTELNLLTVGAVTGGAILLILAVAFFALRRPKPSLKPSVSSSPMRDTSTQRVVQVLDSANDFC